MKLQLPTLPPQLTPYKGILTFVVILFASNFLWKMVIDGDESDNIVHLFDWDISAPFVWMAAHVSHLAGRILQLLGWDITVDASNILRHANKGFSVQVIWACSGIKQAYICFCILAFSAGPWIKKLWYVPLGILAVYVFNVFRIAFIAAYCNAHPDAFNFLHLYVFKYLFYGVIFVMWVIWEEKIAAPERLNKQ